MQTVVDFRRRKESTPTFRRDAPGNVFLRFLTARVIADVFHVPVASVIESCYPSDRTLGEIVERAAVSPAMTTVVGWAAELTIRVVADALEALGPASAGAELLKNSLVLSFDGAGSISAPGFVANFNNAGFVAEGDPIPVYALAAGPAILYPHKLASIAVLTREMIESSNAEALVSDALVRASGRALDEVLFDANPATAARPAGLRNGIAALTPSNQSAPAYAALEDVSALFNSMAPVAGNGPYVLIASPGRAAMMGTHFPGEFENVNVVVLGSSALTNDLIAISPAALVAALSPAPAVETSRAAQLVMDTTPGAAGTTASPNRSLFQTDSIAVKIRWPVSWVLRDPRGVAWVTPTWK